MWIKIIYQQIKPNRDHKVVIKEYHTKLILKKNKSPEYHEVLKYIGDFYLFLKNLTGYCKSTIHQNK